MKNKGRSNHRFGVRQQKTNSEPLPQPSPPAAVPIFLGPATEQEAGAERGGGETVKPKTARPCPWGHQPMWVINGDWDNPDVRCSDPKCPASGKEVSLEVWNELEPEAPKPEPQRCENCDWTFGCFDGSEPCQKKPAQPEPQQSAVEWVKELLGGYSDLELPQEYALDLARRCDAAEYNRDGWMKRCERTERIKNSEADALRAQLAAAQARAEEVERRWNAEKRAHLIMCERYGDAQDQLAEMQAAMGKMKDQLAAAQAEARELREALGHIAKYGGKKTGTEYGVLYHNGSWCAEQACAVLAKHAKEGGR